MMTSEPGMVDANVLVYAVNEDASFHNKALTFVEARLNGEIPICLTPQVLSEFFATVTSSKRLEAPLPSGKATLELEKYFLKGEANMLYFHRGTLETMLELLKKYPVTQQDVFDLQLAATMISNGVKRIYTYNTSDFAKYAGIEVLTPDAMLE